MLHWDTFHFFLTTGTQLHNIWYNTSFGEAMTLASLGPDFYLQCLKLAHMIELAIVLQTYLNVKKTDYMRYAWPLSWELKVKLHCAANMSKRNQKVQINGPFIARWSKGGIVKPNLYKIPACFNSSMSSRKKPWDFHSYTSLEAGSFVIFIVFLNRKGIICFCGWTWMDVSWSDCYRLGYIS